MSEAPDVTASAANKVTAAKPRPLRRFGAVLDRTGTRLLVWINGVTPDEGEWIDERYLPATLHEEGATFDVWLYDDEPITHGAYTLQVSPTTGEPYTDDELFGVAGPPRTDSGRGGA